MSEEPMSIGVAEEPKPVEAAPEPVAAAPMVEEPVAEDRPIDLIHELFGLMKDLHVRDTSWKPDDYTRLSALGNRIKALREKP